MLWATIVDLDVRFGIESGAGQEPPGTPGIRSADTHFPDRPIRWLPPATASWVARILAELRSKGRQKVVDCSNLQQATAWDRCGRQMRPARWTAGAAGLRSSNAMSSREQLPVVRRGSRR
ncbi:hypothetical protein GCM10022235_70310 [Kribbella ginsengisoli]|uniref:Uncharacterized protein n=1 Tax=Kribbella ginsengisoli TaxID=363865 RepID=A0ABP6YUM5_9ACTN